MRIKKEILKLINEGSDHMSNIEKVLYLMMEERVVPGIYKSTLEDMKRNLDSARMTEEDLNKYLYMGIAQGYIEKLENGYYQMTEKAKEYISYRES